MIVAHFDPFSGASGDMILGALVDAGAPLPAIQTELDRLGLPIRLVASPWSQHAIRGTKVEVFADDTATSRTWRDIRLLIESSTLSPSIKTQSLAIFARLAEVEANVHNSPIEEVHFHEVGGLDAIADICGACIALALLGVEEVRCGTIRTGSGFVKTAHGLIPVPAPATAELLARAGAQVSTSLPLSSDSPGELLTPTGAAILTTLASFVPVDYEVRATGLGYGAKELAWPNALRVFIGESLDSSIDGNELLMETNIDDMSPQHMELLMERLFEEGALDVWFTPIQMKKQRPATKISALLPANKRASLASVMIEQSTTLGVRVSPVERTKTVRRIETVTTRWGDVRVKLRGWNGRVIDAAPEYDDCAAYARVSGLPLRDVWNEAHRLAESYVGRKITESGNLG